jgi:hypothetical protein
MKRKWKDVGGEREQLRRSKVPQHGLSAAKKWYLRQYVGVDWLSSVVLSF